MGNCGSNDCENMTAYELYKSLVTDNNIRKRFTEIINGPINKCKSIENNDNNDGKTRFHINIMNNYIYHDSREYAKLMSISNREEITQFCLNDIHRLFDDKIKYIDPKPHIIECINDHISFYFTITLK